MRRCCCGLTASAGFWSPWYPEHRTQLLGLGLADLRTTLMAISCSTVQCSDMTLPMVSSLSNDAVTSARRMQRTGRWTPFHFLISGCPRLVGEAKTDRPRTKHLRTGECDVHTLYVPESV